jgi:MerR family redox-sensitive transcriptional activator SoxR
VVRIALDAGFTIRETRTFLTGFDVSTKPSARWRALASRKLVEVDAQMERARRMKALLESSFRCGCPRIEDCERAIASKTCR